MPRLSVSTVSGNKSAAHSGKGKHIRTARSVKAGEDYPRKLSMDAYYRPCLRGPIEVEFMDDDEEGIDQASHIETEVGAS